MTDRQAVVLEEIRAHIRENGWAPSVRELGARIGVTSTSTTQAHLDALEREGLIVRGGGNRTLRVVERAA